MTAASAIHQVASPTCLVLGPDADYLHHVVATWRKVSKGPLAGINFKPTRHGKTGIRLTSADALSDWMAQQPSGALVAPRYDDAPLIARSHRDHGLPAWEHLIIEDAHRTAEGIIEPDHPHAVIHYDDGILAYKRLYLTATPRIPRELIPNTSQRQVTWAVDMPAQPIFGTHQTTVDRQTLVDKGLLSPYQFIRIQVPEPSSLQPWRAEALGVAHAISQQDLRRVLAVFKKTKQAEKFACQLAVQMLDAEILVPPQRPERHPHNQPIIHCQRATDPPPTDLDAIVLTETRTAVDLVNLLRPLMGQHASRAARTTIVVPEPIASDDAAVPCTVRRIAAALWAHNPVSP